MMVQRLQDKVAIVTGAGSGLGRAAALRLAREGALVACVDLDERNGLETVALIGAAGSQFIQADVSSVDGVRQFVEKTFQRYGRIDILFNNAGIEGPVAPIADYDEIQFDRVMEVNVRSVFLGMKYVVPIMLRQSSGGSIINNSSIRGMVGRADICGYVASKHAVSGLTKSVALEYGQHGIRVNAICPGPIDTDMVRLSALKTHPDDPDKYYESVRKMIPDGRLGQPEEVAALVAYLSSDEAAFINGAIIPIDGAMTAI